MRGCCCSASIATGGFGSCPFAATASPDEAGPFAASAFSGALFGLPMRCYVRDFGLALPDLDRIPERLEICISYSHRWDEWCRNLQERRPRGTLRYRYPTFLASVLRMLASSLVCNCFFFAATATSARTARNTSIIQQLQQAPASNRSSYRAVQAKLSGSPAAAISGAHQKPWRQLSCF